MTRLLGSAARFQLLPLDYSGGRGGAAVMTTHFHTK